MSFTERLLWFLSLNIWFLLDFVGLVIFLLWKLFMESWSGLGSWGAAGALQNYGTASYALQTSSIPRILSVIEGWDGLGQELNLPLRINP